VKAMLIEPNGTVRPFEGEGLEAMQEAVGGYVELVSSPCYDVLVNEDGIRLQLEPNPVATAFCRFAGANVDGEIRGKAILAGKGWLK